MNQNCFKKVVKESIKMTERVLIKKGLEYSSDEDRLSQFYRAANMQSLSPAEALVAMAIKHFTSICDMAKDPNIHEIEKWDEKLCDLRNYTILLDALVRDLRSPNELG